MEENNQEHPLTQCPAPDGAPSVKLSTPGLAQYVPRPRLFALLDEARRRAAVWIAAPGGAGKTTLMVTYIRERELPHRWYQLDKDDADPATFFYYLGMTVDKLSAAERDVQLPRLTPEYGSDLASFARRYFRNLFSLLPPGTVLVLDNHQFVSDEPAFHEILRAAIGEVPESSNLAVISRSNPPPALARQRAIGALAIIDWEEMRLTLEETAAIVARGGDAGQSLVQALHRRSEGWITGLILLMERMTRKDVSQVISNGSLQPVFDYFAGGFFNGLPEATQDFLLTTAMLPHMTPALAAAISGDHHAAEMLADLYRRHLYIQRRELAVASYQYHGLFREFLLNKGLGVWGPARHAALLRKAASLLVEHGRQEEAAAMLLQAQDWPAAAEAILSLAPQLLAQGRTQILAGWIEQMPAAMTDSSPWLQFWMAVSQQFVNPLARALLERAYGGFQAGDDAVGRMLSAAAIIDLAYVLRQGFHSVIAWIDALQAELDAAPAFPCGSIEAKVLTCLVSTLTFIRPQDIRLSHYAERLVVLIDDDEIDVNQKVWMAGHVLCYLSFIRGDMETSRRIMARIWPLLEAPELTIVNNIFWRHMCLPPYFMMGRDDEAREALAPVSALIKDNNLPFLEVTACLFELMLQLRAGDARAVLLRLQRMEKLLNADLHPLDVAWLAFAKFMYAVISDDREAIERHGRVALAHHEQFAMLSIVMEINCILAIVRCEQGVPREIGDYLAVPARYEFGLSPNIRHQVLLIEAYAALLSGDRHACQMHLHHALQTADRRPFFGHFFCWVPRQMMSRLCAEALRASMETDFVRQIIRRQGLLPENSAVDDWPWPVKIYALGHFYLVREGESRLSETKAQRKPLSLLEVLIAFGGSDVPAERIIEVLWPDAEGDAAVSAFTTTVSRLRKLIGHEALMIRRGRVSLDRRRCWVDVAALERHIDRGIDAGDPAVLHRIGDQILALYGGPFLDDEEGDWPRPLRDRLRSRLCRFLAHCAAAAPGQPWVINLAERIITADAELEAYCAAIGF